MKSYLRLPLIALLTVVIGGPVIVGLLYISSSFADSEKSKVKSTNYTTNTNYLSDNLNQQAQEYYESQYERSQDEEYESQMEDYYRQW